MSSQLHGTVVMKNCRGDRKEGVGNVNVNTHTHTHTHKTRCKHSLIVHAHATHMAEGR